jgi:hypothetical protein
MEYITHLRETSIWPADSTGRAWPGPTGAPHGRSVRDLPAVKPIAVCMLDEAGRARYVPCGSQIGEPKWEPMCTVTELHPAMSGDRSSRSSSRRPMPGDVRRLGEPDLGAGGRGFESRHPDWSQIFSEYSLDSWNAARSVAGCRRVSASVAGWRGRIWLPCRQARQFPFASDTASIYRLCHLERAPRRHQAGRPGLLDLASCSRGSPS